MFPNKSIKINSMKNENKIVRDWLIKSLRETGKKQVDIVNHLGVTKGAVSKWTKNGYMTKDNLFAVAQYLGVNVPEKYNPVVWSEPSDINETHVFIPVYDIHLSAGSGSYVYDEKEKKKHAFTKAWVDKKGFKPDKLICMYVKGDSMSPVLIDGGIVTINTEDQKVSDGMTYALRYGDEVKVKLLYKRPDGGLIIRSHNSANYPDITVSANEMEFISIIGRVVNYTGDL